MLATVCELLSKGIASVCVEKAETKCVSLKHLPQRCCSACGANCESALLLMLCWQPSASKRWKQKIHLLFLYWCFQQCGKLRLTKPSALFRSVWNKKKYFSHWTRTITLVGLYSTSPKWARSTKVLQQDRRGVFRVGETLTSTMLFSLWSQVCDSLSVMLVQPIVGLR